MSKRIAVGDWFLHKPSQCVYRCLERRDNLVIIDFESDDSREAAYTFDACTCLPASPRDLIKLWKLAEKYVETMHNTKYEGIAGRDLRLFFIEREDKRTPRKGKV